MTVAEVIEKINFAEEKLRYYENLRDKKSIGDHNGVIGILHDYIEILRNLKVQNI